MKILAIGDNAKELAQQVFEQTEVDTAHLKPDKKQKYDKMLSYMVLPRVSYRKVEDVFKSWVDALNPSGELVIFVPSLEWAAVQILSPERNPALAVHLFGMQDKPSEYYSCGFTMMDLRALCARMNIAVTHASTGEYLIGEYICECHTVRGVKK